jgi:hypothetical protein
MERSFIYVVLLFARVILFLFVVVGKLKRVGIKIVGLKFRVFGEIWRMYVYCYLPLAC